MWPIGMLKEMNEAKPSSDDRVIYKYSLEVTGEVQVHFIPGRCWLLDVQPQGDIIQLWFEVEPGSAVMQMNFVIRGTGHPYKKTQNESYCGTVQIEQFVWHVFQVR